MFVALCLCEGKDLGMGRMKFDMLEDAGAKGKGTKRGEIRHIAHAIVQSTHRYLADKVLILLTQ